MITCDKKLCLGLLKQLSHPFGISLSKRALLVTVSCEALETTWNKQEPALPYLPGKG